MTSEQQDAWNAIIHSALPISDWERTFLRSLKQHRWERDLTPRQAEKLADLATRIERIRHEQY